ncbi:nitroreductase [Amycolatopsis sp. WAC 04169]|uniref:Putative oxidoreductase n=1 Tax=Amycolatopsis keratiniphila TaxID=129921 RepID=R4T541_9PSEU|nr:MULTISPECIES: nitroreductase family protein [Amycolatopsis]AGM09930.1 putative oxidoreductase [Amycolatopsis keratiniphila]RSN19790.1 nitroreductase [Amycolatopsis sp. WAC 04169]
MDTETLLTTTRSVRRKLDLDRPVDEGLLEDCVRVAQQAPAAGMLLDAQRWVIVRDPDLRAEIAKIVRAEAIPTMAKYGHLASEAVMRSARHLVDNLGRVPALAIPCMIGRPPSDPVIQNGYYGSVYPAIWSFQLALRSKGLGSSMCAYHLPAREAEVAKLLGIPEDVAQISLLAVAHTTQRDFSPAARRPAGEILSFDRWARSA